jgi:hypothetical protein
MRGAVLYGMRSDLGAIHVMRQNYGIATSIQFHAARGSGGLKHKGDVGNSRPVKILKWLVHRVLQLRAYIS